MGAFCLFSWRGPLAILELVRRLQHPRRIAYFHFISLIFDTVCAPMLVVLFLFDPIIVKLRLHDSRITPLKRHWKILWSSQCAILKMHVWVSLTNSLFALVD
jgi:hypothetical protein